MKVLIILSLSVMVAFGSLEPSGYKPPNSGILSNHYLSMNNDGSSAVLTPESHYLPTSYQNPTSPNVIPNSQYLPSNHDAVSPHRSSAIVAMPSVQYLPTAPNQPPHLSGTSASISSHYHHDHNSISPMENLLTNERVPSSSMSAINLPTTRQTVKSDVISSRYLPPSQRPGTFTQVIPSSNYLPAHQNKYTNEIDQPSTSVMPPLPSDLYVTPKKFKNPFTGSTAVPPLPPTHLNNHNNKADNVNQSTGLHDKSSANGNSIGYSDSFHGYDKGPEVKKYEFEYVVKDEMSGNDFSHKESRNDDGIQGVYTVLLPDGRKQIVHYTANSEGYKPSITYEDSVTRNSGYNQGYKY